MPDLSALRIALIAPPPTAVPASALGGLDQVRWLAEGLAAHGHHVTLIGAGLHGLNPGRYVVADTAPDRSPHGRADQVEQALVEEAGRLLGQLDVQVVSDHARGPHLLAPGRPVPIVRTVYDAMPARPVWSPRPAPQPPPHVRLVAVSLHQQRQEPTLPWVDTIRPGIPLAEHPVSLDHDGPCLYLGPLLPGYGADLAIDAAHQAGRLIVVAGTRAGAEARVHAQVRLLAKLGADDRLIEEVGVGERWDLLAAASCLIAPLPLEEPCSLEIVEALAYGCPVVGLYRSVAHEQVDHGVSGLLVLEDHQLANAVRRVELLDPKEIRERATGACDVTVMVDAYEGLFRRLAGEPIVR